MQSLLQKLFPRIFSYDEDSYISRLRSKRMNQLRPYFESVKAEKGGVVRILDVGGSHYFWKQSALFDPDSYHVTILNRVKEDLPVEAVGFSSVSGDACDLSSFKNKFDIVFSNSVIEHVGSVDNQIAMAKGIEAIGPSYIVQTPNFWFPLDPHSQVLCFQFLPHWFRAFLIKIRGNINWFPAGKTYSECIVVSHSIDMLSGKRFKKLFPNAEIITERLLGLPKSFIAVKTGNVCSSETENPLNDRG